MLAQGKPRKAAIDLAVAAMRRGLRGSASGPVQTWAATCKPCVPGIHSPFDVLGVRAMRLVDAAPRLGELIGAPSGPAEAIEAIVVASVEEPARPLELLGGLNRAPAERRPPQPIQSSREAP